MRLHKFGRIMREHPYLMSGIYTRSRNEAVKMYCEGFPAFNETIARAKARSSNQSEAWSYFEKIAMEQELHDKKLKKRNALFRTCKNSFLTHKRAAIACTIIAFIIAFFTLFPTGRALAKEIFDYILNVFGTRVVITDRNSLNNPEWKNQGDTYVSENEMEFYAEYSNIDEFIRTTGLHPFTIEFPDMICLSLSDEYSMFAGRTLRSEFRIGTDGSLIITQIWNPDSLYEIQGNSQFSNSIVIGDNSILYYSIDAIDHSFDGVCLLDDSICQIHVNKEPYISQILDVIQK